MIGKSSKKQVCIALVHLVLMTLAFPIIYSCNKVQKNKNAQTNNWYEQLPACPCRNPDWENVKLNDGWARDAGDISKYHRGANECFRSYPPIETIEGSSGQQCCYDAKGDLITNGSAAGTPDKESTCKGENTAGRMLYRYEGVLGHYRKDIRPWEDFGGINDGWKKYNELWKPNNGNHCPANKLL